MVRYTDPPAEYLEKYQSLYAEMDKQDGMRVTDIMHAIGASSGGSAISAIASLEALGLYVWVDEHKVYHPMKREDEL